MPFETVAARLPHEPPDPRPYDALLLVSFGGPEKPDDVLPFLRNVTAGRDVPDARLEEVGEHYFAFGGHIAFVTHAIPKAMSESSGPHGGAYVAQHQVVAAEIIERVREETGHRYVSELVFCSRSGPPQVPWLEPDINDHLRALRNSNVPGVVVAPIGLVSDHLEVIYDLDTEARATAQEIGLPFSRASTAGLDQRFVAMVRDLLLERAAVERGESPERAAEGSEAVWDVCAARCCPNPRGPEPALCGLD